MKSTEIPDPEATSKKKGAVAYYLQIALSIIILGCGATLAAYYLKTGPEAKPNKRQASRPLVQVTTIHFTSHRLTINSMGTVLAAKEINLTPGVGGEIIALSDNMVPGGFFVENETLVTIDPIDYQLAIKRLQSEVAKAQNDIELEMGNQRIARKEFEILGEMVTETEKKLMLRAPQLGIKKATLQGVKANLAQAELNLKRTRVHAPFNGVVLSRSVNLGTRIAESTILARLVGTDEFWLKLTIPANQLQWINFPTAGKQSSEVRMYLQEKRDGSSFRTGRVLRPAADLEEQGRMAVVYVAIKDPLCLQPENSKKSRLLLDSFVQAEIEGMELTRVVAINRDNLREDNSIWLLKEDNTLEIRKVPIVAKTNDQVFVQSGLADGERLIVSDLSSPVPGSPLQVMPSDKNQTTPDATATDNKQTERGDVIQ